MRVKSNPSSQMRICGDCVGDSFLRAKIQKRGKQALCDFCTCSEITISLKSLAVLVEKALQTHYSRAEDWYDEGEIAEGNAMASDASGTPIAEVIALMSTVELDVAEHIRSILEDRFKSKSRFCSWGDTPFSPHMRYVQQSLGSYENDVIWNEFKTHIKEKSRFFNQPAADALRCVFGINKTKSPARQSLISLVASPGSEHGAYYRARVFKTIDEVEVALKNPEKDLGPPPTEKATDGRMNAFGIPVFYGAFDPKTALAEIRPPVGSFVLLGRFKLLREIHLLDLDQMKARCPRGSVFDPRFEEQIEWFRFLSRFEDEITRPVQPGDEAFSYLPTQAVADFLGNLEEVSLDGVVFKSSQRPDGRNIVLFNKASRIALPLDADLSHRRVQIWRDQIGRQREDAAMVIDEPSSEEAKSKISSDNDSRLITLALDKDSIEMHQIKEITVLTSIDKVTWLKR